MNDPNPEEVIFAAARQLAPEDRAACLDQACGDNGPLRRRIEALLNASEQSGAFLEISAAPTLRRTPAASIPLAEKPGDKVGRYKLLQQIGEGGCGVVYMAEQEEPVRRRVALKIIKLGMDTRQVIARFEAERQALAMMDHPNIAKVFDAGATETGRPYFVMELVRGVKITDYCDETHLSIHARLDLFMQVCHAIQHAHQKGIIHRDIKPSNILVTVNDGVPVPKVIDFGIVKATGGQQLTDKTIFTAFEQFIGTPAYMSPEQAVMTSLDIDTRSDIYALGVLLYELLTGKTPFDSKELLAIGLNEMRRTICEKEPERPSTRVSTLPGDELGTTAQRRGLDAPKLASELRGDLDWIVMKALEKDRARRYETANGLGMDIQRHLNNEPVAACPPSATYRFKKMVQRNKLAFVATSAVALALLLGFGVSTWMFFKEKAARQRAVAAERGQSTLIGNMGVVLAAEGRFADVSTIYMGLPDSAHTRRAFLLRQVLHTLARQRKFASAEKWFTEMLDVAGQNRIRRAEVLAVRGQLYARHGHWQEATADLKRAIEILPDDSDNWSYLAPVLVQSGALETYREYCRRSVERFGKTSDPATAERISKSCLILPTSGASLQTVAKLTDTAISGDDPGLLAWSQFAKSLVEYRQEHFTAALDWIEKTLANANAVPARDVGAYMVQAMAYHRLEQPDKSRSAWIKGAELEEKLPKLEEEELGTGWIDCIIARALLREAKALIEGQPATAKDASR